MTGNLAAIGARSLGALGASENAKRWGMHLLALGLVASGGAATGWLSSGTKKGAVIGGTVHLGLYGLAGAFFGAGRLGTGERVAFGSLGLGAALLAAYLFFGRSKG